MLPEENVVAGCGCSNFSTVVLYYVGRPPLCLFTVSYLVPYLRDGTIVYNIDHSYLGSYLPPLVSILRRYIAIKGTYGTLSPVPYPYGTVAVPVR